MNECDVVIRILEKNVVGVYIMVVLKFIPADCAAVQIHLGTSEK